jgi:AraC-like DNA-binding protein
LFSWLIPDRYAWQFTQEQLVVVNGATIISGLCFILLLLYYYSKWRQCRIKALSNYNIFDDRFDNEDEEITLEEIERCNKLYDRIVAFFEQEKPYLDSEFSISDLSSAVGSSASYIYKAIKRNKHMNFSNFVNLYRINMVKDMIDKNYHNTYTIKYIYTMAGFSQQTTFNKVFKSIEGITPTEYIQTLTKWDNNYKNIEEGVRVSKEKQPG